MSLLVPFLVGFFSALLGGYVGYRRGYYNAVYDCNAEFARAVAAFDNDRLARDAKAIRDYANNPHSVLFNEEPPTEKDEK